MRFMLAAAVAIVWATGASPSWAAPEVDGEIAVVTDYRYRGYSLSGSDPALQGGLTVTGASGVYANIWASTIDEYGGEGEQHGATVELDFTLGRAFQAGGFDLDVGVSAYTYPGARDVHYLEIPASISRATGAWTWTAGLAYAPRQANLGHRDNVYVYGAAAFAPERLPVTFDAALGWEDGAFGDAKTDWSLGVGRTFGPATLSLRYVDADAADTTSAVVGALSLAF